MILKRKNIKEARRREKKQQMKKSKKVCRHEENDIKNQRRCKTYKILGTGDEKGQNM